MVYPKNFESKVGFDEIRTLLKGRCLSALGSEEIGRLAFSANGAEVRERLEQISEFRQIMALDEGLPTENFHDMREALMRIQAKGTYMEETELHALRMSLATTAGIVAFLSGTEADDTEEQRYPALKRLAHDVECFPHIIETIDGILNKFGRLKDNASPELNRVRLALAETKRGITISLHRILHKAQESGYVEKDVSPTLRDGRLVIPVAPALKRKIRGIVHDESASGKTVFIEPAEVVEANNKVRELELEEKRAIIAILQSATDTIRPHIEGMMGGYLFLGKVDAVRAKAIFAESIGGIEPGVEDRPVIDWVQAVHPLLEMSLRRHGKKMNPLDIAIGGDERILLISGPNAGGKSVCLKTAGLLQYMVQCGLSIPVRENSKVGIFHSLFIDIGDEQSLEDDLSTYSSHLENMKQMMKACNDKSLILIDEFGGGTEPQIGAAIAQAMLSRFLKNGTYGIITTHYQNLKDYADNHSGIVNAAMLYDRQLMQPLFQLQTGHPGSSFAIEIARKTGIPEDVIREASDIVGEAYIQSDKYLQDIVRDKRYWENKRQNVHQKEKRLEELIARYEKNVKEIDNSRKEIMQQARTQAEDLLRQSNAQIENTIRSIREAQAEKEQTKRIRRELNEYRDNLGQTDAQQDDTIERKMRQIMERRARREQRKSGKTAATSADGSPKPASSEKQPLKVGDYVTIKGQNTTARITKLNGSNAIVTSGVMQVSVKTSRLIPAEAPKQEDKPAFSFIGKDTRDQIYEKKLTFHPEIDVRGMSGEEALQAVTYFIDDALLLSQPNVRILHGTGSGYLRMVIRQYLRTVPGVASFHDEHVQLGGAGITIVEFQ